MPRTKQPPGMGTKCPRCLKPKPKGNVGKGVSLSRRGTAYICSDCGTEEAIIDCGHTVPDWMVARVKRLEKAILKSGGTLKPKR